jgi:hypothetical protein
VNDVVLDTTTLKASTNKYDWLGHGIYFWDNSFARALEYATFLRDNPGRSKIKIKTPAVLGAVINLGHCLDLLDFENLELVKLGYEILVATNEASDSPIPVNKVVGGNEELLVRELDCAVFETLHEVRREKKLPAFDSVRGVFWEGKRLYPNAGFREKDHIQICIRNPNCIKGYFLPRKEQGKFSKV